MARSPEIVVGFRDRPSLAHAMADALRAQLIFAEESSYAGGEMAIRIACAPSSRAIVASDVTERPESMFRALLAASALRAAGTRRVELIAPWIAYGRQDRAVEEGEAPAGLVVGKTLAQSFDRIVTLDAHSPAFLRSFGSRITSIGPEDLLDVGAFENITMVVAPDAGAGMRAKRTANALGVPCLIVEKHRVGPEVVSRLDAPQMKLMGAHVLIVDDMTDSGRTLEAAACASRLAGAASVRAHVTHALDLAYVAPKLAICERVSCVYDHATHRLSPRAIAALARAVRAQRSR